MPYDNLGGMKQLLVTKLELGDGSHSLSRPYHPLMEPERNTYALATFEGLWAVAQRYFAESGGWAPNGGHKAIPPNQGEVGPLGSLHCPGCSDERRMFIRETYVAYRAFYPAPRDGGMIHKAELHTGCLHAVFILRCAQCDTTFTAVMYHGPSGHTLCLLPSTHGGLATPHSPESVKFYCDQASRAAAVGAYTAALAMLRPAVDVVLELHGYTRKWLGDKLADLEEAIQKGVAPQWAVQYDKEFLIALKKLANDALHTRAERVAALAQKQDDAIYRESEISIAQLLDVIYERPGRDRLRLEKLKNAALPREQK